jgi:hypothetical protein
VKKQAFSFGCILYVRAVADIEVAKRASTVAHSVEMCIVCIVVWLFDNQFNIQVQVARSWSRASWLDPNG